MHVDTLIIGQGICGTFLGHYLEAADRTYIVIDEPKPHSASKAAAGLINPVTGRRIVTTWMIDELLPFAENAYRQIGADLGINAFEQQALVDFFPSPQMRLAFLDRYNTDPAYLSLPADEHDWDPHFHYELGYGLITPCCLVNLPGLLAAAHSRLLQQGRLREESFDISALHVPTPNHSPHIHYRDITADRIIFCDGVAAADNPWFSKLPFAPNKGEALILKIPGLPRGIYKKGLTLAPWGTAPDLFWIGSSYEWSFKDEGPTTGFREKTEATLQGWLKHPYEILDHLASVRPATLERRPFVGFHPTHPSIGILNGMGTKGCSLAPYFADQLVRNIITGTDIRPDADVKRFSKILSR